MDRHGEKYICTIYYISCMFVLVFHQIYFSLIEESSFQYKSARKKTELIIVKKTRKILSVCQEQMQFFETHATF